MNKKKIILLIILLFLLPFISLLFNTPDTTERISPIEIKQIQNQIDSKPPKIATYQTYNELWIDDSGMSGNGTWDYLDGKYSWCTYTGGYYIIENITLSNLDGLGDTLMIANSSVDFIIRNCTILNSQDDNRAGIKLYNTSYGQFYNLNILQCEYGIYLEGIPGNYSTNNRFKNLTISTISNNGIEITTNCNNNEIINSTFTDCNNYAIYSYQVDDLIYENNTITGGDGGFYVSSTHHTIVRNNRIINCSENGILYRNSDNLILSNNTMQNCGINFYSADNKNYLTTTNIYLNNTVNGNPVYFYKDQNGLNTNDFTYAGQPGEIILFNCNYSTISNFNLSYYSGSIHLLYSNHNTISNNFLKNHHYGIALISYCNSNSIFNNTIIDSLFDSIGLYQYNYNNTIIKNTIIGAGWYGIHFFFNNENNLITNNNVKDANRGIQVYRNDNNNITHNILKENRVGIFIQANSKNIFVYNNTCVNNNDYGITILSECHNNTVLKNNCSNSVGGGPQLIGIVIENNCYQNKIIENEIHHNNVYGIDMDNVHYNNITNNSIIGNSEYGISLLESDNNTITGNVIRNSDYGVYIWANGTNSDNNTIYLNFFKDNNIWHIYINASTTDNYLYHNGIGNWYDNYTGSDPDGDGIGFPPHIWIPEGQQDDKPIYDKYAPYVEILSPEISDEVYKTAPSFELYYYENYTYRMWYSIDGGLTNITFTENGTINQEIWEVLWDSLSYGDNITITFYVEDKPGYIGMDSINVTKLKTSFPPPRSGDGGADDDDTKSSNSNTLMIIIFITILIVGFGISGLFILYKKGLIGTQKSSLINQQNISQKSQIKGPKKQEKLKKGNHIPAKELTEAEKREIEKTESEVDIKREKFICIVHKGKIEGDDIYLCPKCNTFYCKRCAKALKKRNEHCWTCNNEIKI